LFNRIYLDSNVLISAFSGDEREKAILLMEMVGAVPEMPAAPFVTSELTLAESLVRALRVGLDHDVASMDNVLTSSGWLEVVPVARRQLFGVAWIRSQYLGVKLPDAIHVATAIGHGCRHLLTADEGLRGEYQLSAWQWGRSETSEPVAVIRPDTRTLTEVIAWLTS